jgi:hypothetical protein
VRSAAALALLAFAVAGCARERPSALSIAECLRDQGASTRSTTFRHSPAGLADDWTGVTFIYYAKAGPEDATLSDLFAGSREPEAWTRALLGERGFMIVARSDPDAQRIKHEMGNSSSGQALAIPSSGSVLYTSTPLSRRCL